MAHVPVNVSKVESAASRSIEQMAGFRKVQLDRQGKAPGQDGKTFAEALKKAAGGKEAGEPGKIKARSIRTGKTIPVVAVAGKSTEKTAVVKKPPMPAATGKKPREPGANALHTSASAVIRSPGVVVAAQSATPVSAESRAASGNSGKRETNQRSGKESITGLVQGVSTSAIPGSALLEGGSATLTSRARRVEIVDAGKPAHEGKSEKGKLKAGKEQVRPEPNSSRMPAADTGKSENKFAVSETDIDLTRRSDLQGNTRSAAAELARKLDAQAGNEIVRQVKVVLNRADAGEVRINLRPDNLGRVRVQIHLEDNRLTGRIFVESAAAREAFRNALDGLQTRLVESGFGAADLELAWDDGRGSFAGNRDSSPQNGKDSRFAVKEFGNMVAIAGRGVPADGLVNMVV